MSDLREALTRGLSDPQSLKQQADVRSFFLNDHTSAEPSEPNMLSFLTLKDLFKTSAGTSLEEKAIKKTAGEESKFLLAAMKILNPENEYTDAKDNVKAELQRKFGRDLKGANELGKLLRAESIKREFEHDMDQLLANSKILSGRDKLGALQRAT